MILVIIIQKFSKESTKTRNSFIFVATIFLIALSVLLVVDIGALISGGAYDVLPEFRYFNAINPFVFDHDTITQSVQEHKQTTLHLSWVFTMTFMLFGMIGAWILLSGKEKNFKLHIPNHMKVFALIFALFAAYVAGTFMRMNLFNAIGLIILGSIGLAVLLHYFLHKSNLPIKLIFSLVVALIFIFDFLIFRSFDIFSIILYEYLLIFGFSQIKLISILIIFELDSSIFKFLLLPAKLAKSFATRAFWAVYNPVMSAQRFVHQNLQDIIYKRLMSSRLLLEFLFSGICESDLMDRYHGLSIGSALCFPLRIFSLCQQPRSILVYLPAVLLLPKRRCTRFRACSL